MKCRTCQQPAHIGPETNTLRHSTGPTVGSHADPPPERTDLDTRKRCAGAHKRPVITAA